MASPAAGTSRRAALSAIVGDVAEAVRRYQGGGGAERAQAAGERGGGERAEREVAGAERPDGDAPAARLGGEAFMPICGLTPWSSAAAPRLWLSPWHIPRWREPDSA